MSGTKTIGAIAVGTRRTGHTGRSLSLRLPNHELDELIIPTQPREWQTSLRESCSNPTAFRLLIEDMRRLDTEFTKAIDEDPSSYSATSSTLQSNIIKYQEYVDAFVAIFAQFTNRNVDGDHILDALKSLRCPKLDMFRRLVVNPNFIVNDDLENSEVQEMIDSENRKVPVTQLARMCDVAVLHYLGNVTEKTPPSAIFWGLGYISSMTNRIGDSLRKHSESGWYGLSFHKRKSTIRNSSTEVPKLALDGQLIVISVGPSDPVVTMETVRLNNVVPSIAVSDHEDGSTMQKMCMDSTSLRSDLSEVSLHLDMTENIRSSPVPTLHEIRTFDSPSPVGYSIEEMQKGAKRRRHSSVTKPPSFTQLPPSDTTPIRRLSIGSNRSVTNLIYPKRKNSIVEPVKAIIESIDEERQEEQLASQHRITNTTTTTNTMIASSLDRPVTRSPSPLVQSLSNTTTSSPPPTIESSDSEQSDDHSDSDSPDVDISVNYKYKPRNVRYTGPPSLPMYTTETRQTELHTLITHNGRISLLAILNTISKLPSNPHLWTEDNWDACKVCILLIQFCVDFGLDTHKKNDNDNLNNVPFHRQRCLRSDPRIEKPSSVYSKLILRYAVKALIHCAVSTYTGCLIDSCRVNTYCSRNASQNLNKMMHQMERLYSNSPLLFRESMMEFANNAPLQRVFHFLHVILQYCPRGSDRDPLDPSSSRRDPLIVLSATVLRIVIDRMVLMNLSEPMVEHSVVKEAMAFIHFAYTLFNQDFLRTKGFAHLQWYVNRIALSVVLPVRSPLTTPPVPVGLVLPDNVASGTFPRQKKKKKTSSTTDDSNDGVPHKRKRGNTVHISIDNTTSSPLPQHKTSLTGHKPKLVKQSSIHSDHDTTVPPLDANDHIIQELQREWHGINLGVLHQRIRRLNVIMDLTEPGILPDASLLGSLISVGPSGSLVPRSLVLMECALFLNKLNNEEMTIWMKNQPFKYVGNWELFETFKSWGEAIGEALSACEITEKELFSKGSSDPDNNNFTEEPVFNDEERDPDKRYIVNHSLKMVACMLLIEITKFLREPPPTFLPVSIPTLNRSFSAQSQERKPSNISVMSSDSDTSPIPGTIHQTRQGSLDYYRKGSSPMLEDVPKFLSSDHPPSPNTSTRVSMYLRVNSRHGKKHPRTQTQGGTVGRGGKTHLSQVEIPADNFRVVSSNAPLKTTRRMSVSAAAFLSQPQVNTDSNNGTSIRHRARPSVSVHPSVLRRKSISGSVIKASVRKDNSPILSRTELTSKGVQATISPNTIKVNSPQSAHRRPSMLGRVFQQGRKIAQRRRPAANQSDSNRPRASTTTNTSSAASSPGLGHHRTIPQAKADILYDNKLEEIKSHFPWLDVVEHMIVSFYSTSTELQERRKKSCCQLMAALKIMYSLKFEKDKTDDETPVSAQFNIKPHTAVEASIATAFTTGTLLPDVISCDNPETFGTRTMGSIIRSNPAKQVTANDMPSTLGKLDFSGVRLRRFLESGMIWGSKLDGNNVLKNLLEKDEEMLYVSLEYLLETDSSQSIPGLLDSFNSVRLKYVSTFFAGLLHAPFSLLTYAAPVLPSSTFRDLQESAWIALCDQDYEYADAAASFFLLCCVKEKEKMFKFLKAKSKTNHPVAIRDAVTRFDILWRCRDGVWSRMEQSAPKMFKLEEETSDTIGYSLPSQLLGVPGETLPYAPWRPISVCTCDHSKENVQCYQGTKHAPLEHIDNIVKSTRSFPISGTSVIQMEMDTTPAVINSNALLELDREEYEQGIFKIKDVYKLSTLFPNDLLPLITLVIKALDPPHSYTGVLLKADSDMNIPSITQISSMAERLLWHSMLDNPYYLLYPLLNQFNVLYKVIKDNKRKPKLTVEDSAAELLEGILKPFHVLLSHFHHLPPKASHMLFNNFIGIIMRHTEQPVVMSDVIIHSVLTLLRLVVPSIKGLTMKELKNQLKKESCYTTILTTARIRGVEMIRVGYSDQPDAIPKDVPVQESMKFFEVIDTEHTSDNEDNPDPFSSLYSYYLTEEKKSNRTILNSLVIQDYYPATADGSVPIFILHKSATTKNAMEEQEELLYIHKMTELARVMFTIEMLTADTSSTGLHQEFAQPNPAFVLSELQGLNSFPRKALSSLPDEVGLSGLHKWHLRMVDTMLRGVWSKFMLNLFTRVKDYQPNDNVVLFLTVINGSLLLQAEDSSTLRYSLASLLVAATKFESIFRQNAYQMIVPMLLRVYSLHNRNKMVKDAIKFLWTCFYNLSKNTFLLQAIVSIANLFSSEVATIATNMKVNYCPLCIDWHPEEQTILVKSVVELIETLDCTYETLPSDKLDILGACPEDVQSVVTITPQTWSGCSVEQVVPFCITVAAFNPEVLRGMQVMVFLDFIMVQLIKEYVKKNNFQQIVTSIRSLIKGCESLKRSIKTTSKSTQAPAGSIIDDQQDNSINMSKLHIRHLFRKNHSATSQSLQILSRDRSVSELPADEQRAKLFDGFRNRSLQNINQQIVTLSRNSLLSIASQLICHAPVDSKNTFDSCSLMNICSITEKMLRSMSKSNQDNFLDSKGIAAVFNNLLPNVSWDAENTSPFLLLLDRIFKIFRKLQAEYCQTVSIPWYDLTTFINSLQQCVYNCHTLITDNDQILFKFKAILEMCLSIKTNSIVSHTKKRNSHFFLQDAPTEFIVSFVELCAEMIILTQSQNMKHRVLISGLFESALDFKISECSSVWGKMFLLLSVNLGLRDSSCISEIDIIFIMENIAKMVEHVQVVLQHVKVSSQKEQIHRFFNNMRILLSAYNDKFLQEQWISIGYSLLGLTSVFDASTVNELYFEFCLLFLDFWESFVLPCRLPIFSIAWHVIGIIESQLSIIKQNNIFQKQADILNSSLDRCQILLKQQSLLFVSTSKKELLCRLQEEILFGEKCSSPMKPYPTLPLDVERSNTTTTDNTQQQKWSHTSLKRKNSKAPLFPAIDELSEVDMTLSSPDHMGKKDEQPLIDSPVVLPSRPNTLSFKPSIDKQETKNATTGSPKIFKHKPSVSFSEKVISSPSSKKFFVSKPLKSPSSVAEKPKKSYKHRMTHTERQGKDKTESGFEADEEDASLETPRSSVSYPSVPEFKSPITKDTLISSHVKIADMNDKLLTVSAEIHVDDISSLSESADDVESNTSFSTDDGLNDSTITTTKTKSPSLNTKRQMFKTTHVKTVQEPDELTGQINHDQQRNRYFETEIHPQQPVGTSCPSSMITPSPSPGSVIRRRSNTMPKPKKKGVITTLEGKGKSMTPKAQKRTIKTEKRGVATTPKTGKFDLSSAKTSKLYDKSLKQVDGFLGHNIDWPPNDDCSV